MSNLTLPTMTYESLDKIIGGGSEAKLAYATTAERLGDRVIVVLHHGNAIAWLSSTAFEISNGGWDSQTTANRLNRIVKDHGVSDHFVSCRKLSRGDDWPTTAVWHKGEAARIIGANAPAVFVATSGEFRLI